MGDLDLLIPERFRQSATLEEMTPDGHHQALTDDPVGWNIRQSPNTLCWRDQVDFQSQTSPTNVEPLLARAFS
jgi:hypothetical protein